jgi:phosphatidylglycerophosphatase A
MNDTLVPAAQKNKSHPNIIVRLIATGFFSGYSPITPGTAGSLVGLIIYAIPGFEIPQIIGMFICIFFLIGSYTSHRMEIYAGEDPTCVVIDEIVGMWLTLIFIPKTLFLSACGFLLFRIFDITKPQPASYVERYRNGIGVMLDDVVAALYSNILLHLLMLIFPAMKTI